MIPKIIDVKISSVTFGDNVTVVQPSNLYGCKIGCDVFIGPFVEIQKNVTIGNRVRIQSHTFICEYVVIGDDCFIGHGVVFINDRFSIGGPANRNKALWGQVLVGEHVSIGSNATILPVNICNNVVIGAGSVVTKNISSPGFYVGNPARKIRSLE